MWINVWLPSANSSLSDSSTNNLRTCDFFHLPPGTVISSVYFLSLSVVYYLKRGNVLSNSISEDDKSWIIYRISMPTSYLLLAIKPGLFWQSLFEDHWHLPGKNEVFSVKGWKWKEDRCMNRALLFQNILEFKHPIYPSLPSGALGSADQVNGECRDSLCICVPFSECSTKSIEAQWFLLWIFTNILEEGKGRPYEAKL